MGNTGLIPCRITMVTVKLLSAASQWGEMRSLCCFTLTVCNCYFYDCEHKKNREIKLKKKKDLTLLSLSETNKADFITFGHNLTFVSLF